MFLRHQKIKYFVLKNKKEVRRSHKEAEDQVDDIHVRGKILCVSIDISCKRYEDLKSHK